MTEKYPGFFVRGIGIHPNYDTNLGETTDFKAVDINNDFCTKLIGIPVAIEHDTKTNDLHDPGKIIGRVVDARPTALRQVQFDIFVDGNQYANQLLPMQIANGNLSNLSVGCKMKIGRRSNGELFVDDKVIEEISFVKNSARPLCNVLEVFHPPSGLDPMEFYQRKIKMNDDI